MGTWAWVSWAHFANTFHYSLCRLTRLWFESHISCFGQSILGKSTNFSEAQVSFLKFNYILKLLYNFIWQLHLNIGMVGSLMSFGFFLYVFSCRSFLVGLVFFLYGYSADVIWLCSEKMNSGSFYFAILLMQKRKEKKQQHTLRVSFFANGVK